MICSKVSQNTTRIKRGIFTCKIKGFNALNLGLQGWDVGSVVVFGRPDKFIVGSGGEVSLAFLRLAFTAPPQRPAVWLLLVEPEQMILINELTVATVGCCKSYLLRILHHQMARKITLQQES